MNPINGTYLGTQYNGNNCWCFTSACLAATAGTGNLDRMNTQGYSVAMVGTCLSYPFMSTGYSCETVTYPASGCITSNNIACGCAVNAATCDSTTGATLTW